MPRLIENRAQQFWIIVVLSVMIFCIMLNPRSKDQTFSTYHGMKKPNGKQLTSLNSFGNLKINDTVNVNITTAILHSEFPNVNSHKWFIPKTPKYLIEESNFCYRHSKQPSILIYVHSDPSQFVYRSLIRNTWGHYKFFNKFGVLTLFIMGVPEDPYTAAALAWESSIFRDIVQSDFRDSYRNLTYKAITALHWITFHCSDVEYVVKADDDVFINLFNLDRLIAKLRDEHGTASRMIYCWVNANSFVARMTNIVPEEYSETNYPDYCVGFAFLMPKPVVIELYLASLRIPFVWIDDLFVTGLAANLSRIGHSEIRSYCTCNHKKSRSKLIYGDLVFAHMPGLRLLGERERMWEEVEAVESNNKH